MKTKWRLSDLFTSFECNHFKNDLRQLDNLSKYYMAFAKELETPNLDISLALQHYITLQIKLNTLFEKLFLFFTLTLSTKTTDTSALKYSDNLNVKSPSPSLAETLIHHFIYSIINIDSYLNASGILIAHSYLFHEIQQLSSHLLSDKVEAILAKMKNTGSNSFCQH